ncbi:RNA polymerase-associated protein CTR9-like protein [Aphelenchoides bicaudatus]|nr:RNA polymerase-associated protein CTR9-like protein [Aphelenchoides bicaudatus]
MDYHAAYGGSDGFGAESLYFYDDEADGVIPVPKRNGTIITIPLDQLPDVQGLMDVLVTEQVPLSFWVRLAIFYYKKGLYNDFVQLLEKVNQTQNNYIGQEKDKVRALDMLAAYNVQQGNLERSKEERKKWFEKARLHYAMADQVSRYDQNHLIGRAHFCLLEGRTAQEAEAQLDFVLKNLQSAGIDERIKIPACMGKACIMYMRKDYKSSLEFFKKCLQASPTCPAFIRLGIGYCLVKLGKTDKAKIAFERCIELDPENIDAQAALAVLQMTSPQSDDEARSGIIMLGNLYKIEKNHPLILNHLANHFFIKSETDPNADKMSLLMKVKKLLDHAIQQSKNEQILAESNFHLARYYHTQNHIVDAHRHYYQACQFNHPKFVLPFYGYGQTSILMKDTEKAIDSFEKVLKIQPNNIETLRVLGALYARSSTSEATEKNLALERKEKAQNYLKKAAELCPDDIDVLLDLAVLLQRSDFKSALGVYDRLIEHLKSDMFEAPAEIHNNVGVLYYRTKNFEKARESFIACREALLANEIIDEKTKAELIIVSFNLARTDEKLDKFKEAEQIYKGILKIRPNYSDATMRLASMAYIRGDTENAINFCKQLNESDPNNFDAWILHGNIYYDLNQLNHAQKKYEQVQKLGKAGASDPIAMIALGNVWLKNLFDENRIRDKDQKHREFALNSYLRALKINPGNVYAANGAGCILAQQHEVNSACDVFGQVKENVSEYADVWLNIAHIQLDLGHYSQAAQLYQSYLHRFSSGNRKDIYMFTAFAFYKDGKLQSSLDFISRAILEDPNNQLLLYNHAFVSMKYGSERLTSEYSKFEDVQQAVNMLRMSEEVFTSISKKSAEDLRRYKYLSRTQCGDLARQCNDLLRQSEGFLDRAEKIKTEELLNREMHELERLRVIEEHKLTAQRKIEEEALKLEEQKLRRRFFMFHNRDALKAIEVKEEPKQRSSGGGGSRKRKRHERQMDDSDGFVNDYEDETDKVRRKKNKELARKKDRDFINDSDDDRPNRSAKRQSKIMEEDPTRFKGKVKSRAIIEDSSSSDSSGDEAKKSPKQAAASSGLGE